MCRGPDKVRDTIAAVRAAMTAGATEHHTVDEARVVDGPRERTEMVERARQRHDAVGRDLAERRLEAGDAAGGGGDADGAAGVGAERRERHAGGDGDRGPAARPSGRTRRNDRMADRTERRVLARRPER